MRKIKRVSGKALSLMLALIMALGMINMATPMVGAAPETVVEWVATSAMGAAPSHAATTGLGTLSQSKNSSISWSSSAYSASDANAWLWGAEGAYWQLSGISTIGYSNLSLKLNVRSSGTGPRDFKAFYSTDGAAYFPATSNAVDYIAGNAAWNNNNIVLFPSGAGNCADLSIRLVNITNISARAGTGANAPNEAIAGGGTSQIQNVAITGEATGSGDGTIPVAQANSTAVGEAVTVKGQATYLYANNSMMVQDGTGENDGICVYMGGANFSSFIGQVIRVTGVRTDYAGLKEIVPTSLNDITVLSEPAFIAGPKEVTVAQLAAGRHIGSWVVVRDVQLTSRNAATSAQNHTITQSGSSVTLRAALSSAISEGDWLTITGCGYMFNAPQLFAVGSGIVPGAEPPIPGETETIAEWISPTVTDIITATGGKCAADSTLKIVGTASTVLNWANSAINRAGGFDGKAGTAHWLFTTSGADYRNIQISFSIRSSGTGPRDFKVQYSADGTTWADASNPDVRVGNALAIGDAASQFSKSLPSGANGAETLYVRLVQASNISARAGTGTYAVDEAVASGGTNSINNIVISGEFIVSENQLSSPVTDTPSGAVPRGQVIIFTPAPKDAGIAGYAIMVSADGGATWNEAANGAYTLASLPATLQVKATAPGMSDSRMAAYSFEQATLPQVTASRNSGAIIPGVTVRLENAVSGAMIKYSVNGGETEDYIQALTLSEDLFAGEPGAIALVAWAEKEGYIPSAAAIYNYTKAVTGGERVYFGQIHSHTTSSDGIGTLDEAYAYARDVAKLDFFAVTDHSNSFDETGSSSDNPANINLNTYNANSVQWQAGIAAAANAFSEGKFISFYGYEMTWSGGPGHINTFNTGGFASRNNTALNSKTNDAGLRAYYELLTRHPESISMFNHPGTTFGNFNNFAYYNPVIDQRMSLLEVGNGEGEIGSGGYFPSYEQYTLALDKGWHLAPANNQDNHLGLWGNSNTARTAIWTNDLSLGGVYQALREMRVYATEVADLEIVYKVNGQPLGSILDVVPLNANFTAEITNPTAGNYVKSVCLVTNGGAEIQKDTPNTRNYNYSKTIANPAAGYYYLKAIVSTPQGDRIAITAPVWLGQGKAAGFVGVTKSSIMPVTGESLTLASSLFNNEGQAATLQSLEYKDQSGNILGSFGNLNTSINPSGEVSHSVTYTPTAAGAITVTVTAVVKFADDSEKAYAYDISYEVWDADKLVYIGVDASHYNEYVDGNYKDNMANFATIAADYGVRVNILWTSAELIAACANAKYKALILTAPSRRVDPTAMNPTTGQLYGAHRSYSQEELNAIAAFSKTGGTVALTGWSNVYESYAYTSAMPLDEHMASQQNKILAAIGSTLRLSDDAARDPLQWSSSTDQYRLYMTDAFGSYNWANPLLAGAVDSQIFSQYGGSTIYAVAPNDKSAWNAAPSATVPASVTPAIMLSTQGESVNREINPPGTNYRTDYTKYNGRFMLLASETVVHDNGEESLVIAAGGAFMSNFEVKIELENASTLQYSNYNIALNLIKSIAPQPEITDIADIKNMPQGTRVTIEGIATSNVYSGDNATNTGFFDCIYAQDGTGGINLFPVSSGVAEGQKIRVTGTISAYQGETQLAVTSFAVTDADINSAMPTELSTKEAMDAGNTGLLVKVSGKVSEIHKTGDTISQFTVTDNSGIGARVYINAYITSGADLSFVTEGATVSVTGLASIGENQTSSDPLPRIRVRDRNEIVLVEQVPITSIKINAPALTTVVRGVTYKFELALNEGASDEGIIWSTSNPTYATTKADGTIAILNKTGTVILTATDPESGLSNSIILRIV